MNDSATRIVGNGQDADVGDGLDALVKEINDVHDGIIPASLVSKWKTEHLNADMLRNHVVSNVAFLRGTGLTMGGLERLKEHFKINTSDDSPAPQVQAPAPQVQVPAPQVQDEEKVGCAKIHIEYKGKFYLYVFEQICDNNEPDTKVMCKKMHSLVQQDKYKGAKEEVGKVRTVLLETIGELEDMGVIKTNLVEEKNRGKGGNRYDVFKIMRNDPDALVASVTGPKKQKFVAAVRKYKLISICKTLSVRLDKRADFKKLFDSLQL